MHRFTPAQYHKLHEIGCFTDHFVELIDGFILDRANPSHAHAISVERIGEMMKAEFGPRYWIRVQMPLILGPNSEPVPDVAVIYDAAATHAVTPTSAVLIIEVSDTNDRHAIATTLHHDRQNLGGLYAVAGIADYWIVNLIENQLEIRRNPVADAAQPFGYGYADLIVLNPGDVASPLAQPAAQIPVSQLLP